MKLTGSEIQRASSPIFRRMDQVGIRVDADRIKKHANRAESEMLDILSKFGHDSVKSMKGAVLQAIRKSYPDWPRTDEGAISLSQESISASGNSFFLAYSRAVSLQREASGLKSLLSKIHANRLHPEHKCSSFIGRVYVGNFNYTNLAKRNRDIILADQEDHEIWEIDVDRCELVALAVRAEDNELLKALAEADFHKLTASHLFNVDISAVSEVQRAKAKTVAFSIVFGATPYFLVHELGITLTEAEMLISGFYSKYRRTGDYIEKLRSVGARTGIGYTAFGTKRTFELKQGVEKSVVSHEIQSTAAEVVRAAMPVVDKMANALGGRIFGSLFDSFLLSLPKQSEVGGLIAAAEKTMLELGFPMKCKAKLHGDRWA